MGTIQRFEQIDAWQKARQLTKEIYQSSSQGPFAREFGLRDQIRRAAVSVMLNIAEGFERDGRSEFLQFLSIAKGSAGEVRAALYVALDAELIGNDQFSHLSSLAEETTRMIAGFMRYLRSTEVRGIKFKQNDDSET